MGLGDTVFGKYFADQQAVESETPADTLPKGKYPARVINVMLKVTPAGTSGKTGQPYEAFANPSLQIQVLDGAFKGQTTWVQPNLTMPDPSGDDNTDKKRLYFTQHFYDATGLGLKLDPTWQRSEKPNPKKPGKTMTVFRGKVLRKEALLAIAQNETEKAAFEEFLKGLTGIWSLNEVEVQNKDGLMTTVQRLGSVEPMSDANLAAWRAAGGTGMPTSAGTPTTSIYS
jgi:hypothetical protein